MAELRCESSYFLFICNVRLTEEHPIESNCAVLDRILKVHGVTARRKRGIKHENGERTVFEAGELGDDRRDITNRCRARGINARKEKQEQYNGERDCNNDKDGHCAQDLT